MNYKEVYRSLAKQHHTTPEQIRIKIVEAINEAWAHPTERQRQRQNQIPCKGDRPTPEELLEYFYNRNYGEFI